LFTLRLRACYEKERTVLKFERKTDEILENDSKEKNLQKRAIFLDSLIPQFDKYNTEL